MLTHHVDSRTLKNFYYAYVCSLLSCSIIFWGNGQLSNRVCLIQKLIIRVSENSKGRESWKSLIRRFDILTLSSLFVNKSLLYVQKNFGRFMHGNHFHANKTRNNIILQNPIHRKDSMKILQTMP